VRGAGLGAARVNRGNGGWAGVFTRVELSRRALDGRARLSRHPHGYTSMRSPIWIQRKTNAAFAFGIRTQPWLAG
jgi:hypothetical protein